MVRLSWMSLLLVGRLAGGAATVATFVLLYRQLEGQPASDWVGYLLVGSILAWWFLTRRPQPVEGADLPLNEHELSLLERAGGWRVLLGWAGSGLLLAGAAVRFLATHPWRLELDGYFALLAAALVGTELLRRRGQRPAEARSGSSSSPSASARRLVLPGVLRRVIYVALASATPALANVAAVAALLVPVTFAGQLWDSWPGWLALPGIVLMCLLWALAFVWATGMYQIVIVYRHGFARGFSYGSLEAWVTHEEGSSYDKVDYAVHRFRTGLTPLLSVGSTRSISSVESVHSFGATHTVVSDAELQAWFLEFPPRYLPMWFQWVAIRLRPSLVSEPFGGEVGP